MDDSTSAGARGCELGALERDLLFLVWGPSEQCSTTTKSHELVVPVSLEIVASRSLDPRHHWSLLLMRQGASAVLACAVAAGILSGLA